MRKLLYIWLFLSLSVASFGQQKEAVTLATDSMHINVKHFNTKHLTKYKDNPDFNYETLKQEPNFIIRIFNWLGRLFQKFLSWLFGEQQAFGIILWVFKILPYFILLLTLFILAKFFIKINRDSLTRGSLSKKGQIKVLDDETILETEDIDALLQKAIANANYQLAIRFEYLKILKQLTAFNLIDWQVQKTNLDYYNEIKNSQLKPLFKESTHLYDCVWYGNFKVDKGHYSSLKATLDTFLTKLNQFESAK
ncbi:MAG: DUF4129 domain-containing protein [Flavobacteriaceae bacterium]